MLCCSGSVELLQLNPVTGDIMDQTAYQAPRGSRLQSVALHQDNIVALTSDGKQLCIANLLGMCNGPPWHLALVIGPPRHLALVNDGHTLTCAQACDRTGLVSVTNRKHCCGDFKAESGSERIVLLVTLARPVKLLHSLLGLPRGKVEGGWRQTV